MNKEKFNTENTDEYEPVEIEVGTLYDDDDQDVYRSEPIPKR